MLYKIARKIQTTYLDTLSFADRTGGLVRTMNDARKGEKAYPIEVNQDKVVGDNQYLRHLVPNSNLTSVMYFEQTGSPTVVEEHNGWYGVEASLSLVCWFNYQKVDPDMYDPAYLVSEIVSAIPLKLGNFECLAAVTCSFSGEEPNDGGIFDKYTYSDAESQYFKYPYEHFVLTFDIGYRVVRDCEEEGLSDLPVDPVLILMSGNDAKTVTIAGVSGKEYQIRAYDANDTDLLALALHEFSGENQDYTVTPTAGLASTFRLDYGREYLRKIDMADSDIYGITLPDKPADADACLRLEYIDLSGNAIVDEAYFTALIDYLYFSGMYDGTLKIDGGTNAAITDVVSLAYLTVMTARGWTITKN